MADEDVADEVVSGRGRANDVDEANAWAAS